jgi:hypothetical protein
MDTNVLYYRDNLDIRGRYLPDAAFADKVIATSS